MAIRIRINEGWTWDREAIHRLSQAGLEPRECSDALEAVERAATGTPTANGSRGECGRWAATCHGLTVTVRERRAAR